MKLNYRHIPADYTASIERNGAIVHHTVTASVRGQYFAKGFKGRANKSAFHYSFRSEEKMMAYISSFFNGLEAANVRKAERRAARATVKASDFYAVGDILYASWGYDQTNVDFFKVTKVTGRSVCLVEVAASVTETGFMSGNTTAEPTIEKENSWNGMHRVQEGGSVKLASFAYASKWDGRKLGCSWYA